MLQILGAPALFIDMLLMPPPGPHYQPSIVDGVLSFIYISAWMGSIVGLWRAEAAGTNRWGKFVLLVQLFFLTLANISNILILIPTGLPRSVWAAFDVFWPISNIWMLATGITILIAKQLPKPQRFVPLLVGLWVPVQGVCMLVFGKTTASLWAGGLYSAIAWSLLGLVVYQMESKPSFSKAHVV